MKISEGLVLWGVKSIYYVQDLKDRREYKCTIKGKILGTGITIKGRRETNPLVAGDIVGFEISGDNTGLIIERKERKNEIKRLKRMGRHIQTMAANIDQILIVDSVTSPPLRPFFIDRCIISAECMKIPIVIIVNKIDLLTAKEKPIYLEAKEAYNELGYQVLDTSIITGEGLDTLKEILTGKTSSLNGRSGVGKSSLIKKLFPQFEDIRIGEVSQKFNRGKHTTNYAKIYPLGSTTSGNIIDTPGIREFALYLDKPEEVEGYFKDFEKFRGQCKFYNCQHLDEPGCRVVEAVDNEEIFPFRYESYLRIRETVLKLKDSTI